MHPVIRILCLLVIALLAPWLPPLALALVATLLVAWGLARPHTGRAMLRALRRVRWLILSLLILYLWFTPGDPLLPALAALSPTGTGAGMAMHRIGVLAIMVWAATGFLHGLPPGEIAAALRALLTWPVKTAIAMRLADRAGLLFEELPRIEQCVRNELRSGDGNIAMRAARLFRSVEEGAAVVSHGPAAVPVLASVPHRQWLLPVVICLFGGSAFIFAVRGA
ncbi:MAG TPA: hypothetical protein VF267_03495 [Gammaproteobacteria bacterium]